MEGWVKFHRKAYDNFLYQENRPHTKREAWEDIIALVNHEDDKCLIGGSLIECKRGQSTKSLETWAKLFRWNKSKLRRFLILLKKENMLTLENVLKSTRLTICNYDIYQSERNAGETLVKRKRNAGETLTQPKQELKNNIIYTDEQNVNYSNFNKWLQENAPRVLKMQNPITIKEFLKLKEDNYLDKTGVEKLKEMDNWADLFKKISANKTLRNWVNREDEKKSK